MMADFGSAVKNIWMKGMEAIGNTASSIASNTKYKVEEMNMMNRRAEILADFGSKAYALWQKGEHFPAELEEQLSELKKLDEKLNDMRAERYAGVKPDDAPNAAVKPETDDEAPDSDSADSAGEAEENAAEEVGSPEEDIARDEPVKEQDDAAQETQSVPAEEGVPVIRVENNADDAMPGEPASSSLNDAIDDLFEKAPSRNEIENKVNSALDSLGESLQKFSKEIDQGLSDLTDQSHQDGN